MRNRNILFVEDDADDTLLLKHVCGKLGLEHFSFASNGKVAAEVLTSALQDPAQHSTPPLVFLDLNMPEMNGFEFLRWLREENKMHALPVVILSTSESPRDILTAYQLGANAYLVKSSNLRELGNMIQSAHDFWTCYNRVPHA